MATFYGTNGNDAQTTGWSVLFGRYGEDYLASDQPGNVSIYGGAGFDYLFTTHPDSIAHIEGGPGNDLIAGHLLGDELFGDGGNDVVVGSAAYYPAARGGQMSPVGPSGDDTIDGGRHVDALYGFDGDDVIRGGGGSDQGKILALVYQDSMLHYTKVQAGLFGGDGNDQLFGDGGKDLLVAGPGDDQMRGGRGNDVLAGEDGADRYQGGGGADLFVFNAPSDSQGSNHDVIADFSHRQHDGIGLYWMDAKTDKPGNQAFHYIGDHGFTGDSGELRFARHTLSGDVDGDGKADFEIKVEGVNELNEWEFIL